MDDRYSPRVSVDCTAIFAGESVRGEGRVLDVSLPGCLIESSEAATPGDYIWLKLGFPDGKQSLDVPLAVVRWVQGNRIGVEFIRSSEEDGARLKFFVQRHQKGTIATKWKDGIEMLGAVGD
jgi:hypothetical protein